MSYWALALGVVGAVAGSFVPGVGTYAGASLGWAIGSTIGGAIDASNVKVRVAGPKLDDLTIQFSTYGGMVPMHFGTVGVVGMPIDLDVITPHSKETSSSGGKGGGPTTITTTTTYTTSVAIMLGEGVCLGIRKIWRDGKLVFSVAEDANVETLIASSMNSGSFKFYPGTETQLPDPTLEAIHGVGNVPAYRGVAYVVFTDSVDVLNGNSLRQLKFELVYAGTTGIVNKKWAKGPASAGPQANGGPQSFIPNNSDEIVFMRQLSYTQATTGLAYVAAYEVWSITPTAQIMLRRFQVPDQASGYGAIAGSADEVGHLRPWVRPIDGVFQGVYRWILPDDFIPDILDESFDGSFVNYATGTDFIAYNPVSVLAYSKLGTYMLMLGAHAATPTTYTTVKLFREKISSGLTITNIEATRDFAADLAVGETIWAVVLMTTSAWVMSVNYSGAGAYILRKCSLSDLATVSTVTHAFTDVIPGGTGEHFGPEFPGTTEICLAGDIFYMRCLNPSASGNYYILKVDADGGISIEGSDGIGFAVVAGTGIGPDIGAGGGTSLGAQVDLHQSAFGYNPSSRVATFLANENLSPDFLIWPYSVALSALTPGTTTAGAIVSTIAQRAGYTPEQINVSQIPDQVMGYSIASVASARSGIEPMLKYSYSDPVDSDGVTKIIKRGGAPVFTVNFDDLCAYEIGAQMPEPFPFARTQEVDLPSKVIVNFKNPLSDYETGSEPSPQRSTISQNPVTDEVPIVMLPQKAAELASVLYFDQIIQRQPRSFWVPKKFDYVEPTDPGWVEYPRGTFNPVRIVKRDENGPILKFDCVPEDADSYTPNVTAAALVTGQASIVLVAPSTLMLLDIPILQDADDDAGLYAALTGASNKGTSLFRSTDDLNYTELGFVENSAITGFASSVLGAWSGGNVFDEINTLDVSIGTGVALSSTTRDAMLDAGANAAVVGLDGRWEIIQFRAATLVSPNKYRLSSLLRGRRGTEWAIGTHTIGDRFALLGTSGMLRPNEGNMALNARRYYKPVSLGRSLEQTYAQQYTNTGVGLKPFSPVNLRGTRDGSGNLTVTCDRRTRLAIFSRSVPVPLGEASELYDMDIFSDSTYTTIKRTLINVGPAGLGYSGSDQIAEFGSVQAVVYVKVYLKSAIVGRGYAASRGV